MESDIDKVLFLAIMPVIALIIFLGWAWLITSGKKTTTISLHGLGLKVNITSEEWKNQSTIRKEIE